MKKLIATFLTLMVAAVISEAQSQDQLTAVLMNQDLSLITCKNKNSDIVLEAFVHPLKKLLTIKVGQPNKLLFKHEFDFQTTYQIKDVLVNSVGRKHSTGEGRSYQRNIIPGLRYFSILVHQNGLTQDFYTVCPQKEGMCSSQMNNPTQFDFSIDEEPQFYGLNTVDPKNATMAFIASGCAFSRGHLQVLVDVMDDYKFGHRAQ